MPSPAMEEALEVAWLVGSYNISRLVVVVDGVGVDGVVVLLLLLLLVGLVAKCT